MRMKIKMAALAVGAPLLLPLVGGTALAADATATANLAPVPLNGSQGSGTTTVTLHGNRIDFMVAASGLADGPHAAHIHFGEQARHECPRASEGRNGHISTTNGQPAYGPIVVSLTRSGDTSPASGLAIGRFATGTDIKYFRAHVTVPSRIARAIANSQGVIVIHGVKYTGRRAKLKSDLNPHLPASATDPAICGKLLAAPSGGAATGAGGTAPHDDLPLAALGGGLLLAAGGAGTLAFRRARA